MKVPVGLSVFSGLGAETIPYLDSLADRFDSIWLPDHLQTNQGGTMEGWTLLSYCLGRYPDKKVGHQVLCNEFRSPALLAKMAATAQVLSNGKFVLGLGAGWHRGEAEAFGIEFPTVSERVDRLMEAVALVRRMWAGGSVDFDGRFYRLTGATCVPAPDPVPPVMIGASGAQHGLRAVASSADWWNSIFTSVGEYARKAEALRVHCERIQRDPEDIKHVLGTQILIGETEAEVRKLQLTEDVRSIESNGIAGTPEQILEALSEALELGAEMVITGFADSPGTYCADLFSETVLSGLSSA